MNLKNYTPHAISIKTGKSVQVLEPDGPAVRVKTRMGKVIAEENGVAIHAAPRIVGFQNLPSEQPGIFLIVSQLCAVTAARLGLNRQDLIYPVTTRYLGAERDESGILSVSRFARAS